MLGGAFLGAGIALYIRRRNSHESALNTFRSAFVETLTALRGISIGPDAKVFDLLREAYSRHETAYRVYQGALGPIGRWRLRRRWMTYRGSHPTPPKLLREDEIYRLAHFISASPDEERCKRYEAIHIIETLINLPSDEAAKTVRRRSTELDAI